MKQMNALATGMIERERERASLLHVGSRGSYTLPYTWVVRTTRRETKKEMCLP
jgi:hypothetical protein